MYEQKEPVMRLSTIGVTIAFGSLLLLPRTVAAQPASVAEASVPRVMQFNGTFRPSNGQPPAPVEIVTFAIYADETGGTALWQETQNVTIESGGGYGVVLGSTNPAGVPVDVFASGQARWLGVYVNRPGESEQARIRIMSVPYALRSADADTLGGKPASAYLLANPSATSTSSNTKQSAGTANTNSVTTLSANTNWIPVAIDNAGGLGNSSMFQSGAAIGLGTTVPLDAFHVAFTDPNGLMTGLAVQNKSGAAAAYSGMLFYDQNGALGQFQGFNNSTHEYRINNIASGGSINFMLGSSSKFQVRADGDVNISGNIRQAGAPFLHNFGTENTFVGVNAGNLTMTGTDNAGSGFSALGQNTTGNFNTASGAFALSTNTTGNANTAAGVNALKQNTSGFQNTAYGTGALGTSATGSNNVAVGFIAGNNATGGSNNIYLGASASGQAGESNTIYLGVQGTQTKTVIAGIRGITTGAADAVSVVIDSHGQLGTINSSRRYKEDIHDMGDASSRLMQLRPVTYRYKQAYADGTKPTDYGLIAEEVELVYPDLVVHLADGEVETVQYQKINAMLLNEVQKQHRTLEEQRRQIEIEHTEIELLKARLEALEAKAR
jgi:hypothetical protein